VPVIEASRAGMHAALAAAAARAAGAGEPVPARARNTRLVPAIVSAWQGTDTGAGAEPAPAECPVCIDATEPA
jgi:hypothetical protein